MTKIIAVLLTFSGIMYGAEVSKYPTPPHKEYLKSTPLMLAAGHADIDEAQRLLQRGSDVNAQNTEARTALMYAIYPRFDGFATGYDRIAYHEISENYPGSESMVEFLLRNKAHIDAADNAGCTSLMYTVTSAQPNITTILLEHGARVDIQRKGRTVFDFNAKGLHRISTAKAAAEAKVQEILNNYCRLMPMVREGLEATCLSRSSDVVGIVEEYIFGEQGIKGIRVVHKKQKERETEEKRKLEQASAVQQVRALPAPILPAPAAQDHQPLAQQPVLAVVPAQPAPAPQPAPQPHVVIPVAPAPAPAPVPAPVINRIDNRGWWKRYATYSVGAVAVIGSLVVAKKLFDWFYYPRARSA